jgi:hypothetical protein
MTDGMWLGIYRYLQGESCQQKGQVMIRDLEISAPPFGLREERGLGN